MRHQIPAFLALCLILSVALLTGQLVMNTSQDIQANYAEANMYDVQAQAQATMIQVKK